jgi:hypothetical protein
VDTLGLLASWSISTSFPFVVRPFRRTISPPIPFVLDARNGRCFAEYTHCSIAIRYTEEGLEYVVPEAPLLFPFRSIITKQLHSSLVELEFGDTPFVPLFLTYPFGGRSWIRFCWWLVFILSPVEDERAREKRLLTSMRCYRGSVTSKLAHGELFNQCKQYPFTQPSSLQTRFCFLPQYIHSSMPRSVASNPWPFLTSHREVLI